MQHKKAQSCALLLRVISYQRINRSIVTATHPQGNGSCCTHYVFYRGSGASRYREAATLHLNCVHASVTVTNPPGHVYAPLTSIVNHPALFPSSMFMCSAGFS
jgi:hypothetical protein